MIETFRKTQSGESLTHSLFNKIINALSKVAQVCFNVFFVCVCIAVFHPHMRIYICVYVIVCLYLFRCVGFYTIYCNNRCFNGIVNLPLAQNMMISG